MNRLYHIDKLCQASSIEFRFCAGNKNPADCITRTLSYKQLLKSIFFASMQVDEQQPQVDFPRIIVPNPLVEIDLQPTAVNVAELPAVEGVSGSIVSQLDGSHRTTMTAVSKSDPSCKGYLLNIDKISSYSKVVGVCRVIISFVNKLKQKLHARNPSKCTHLRCLADQQLHDRAYLEVLLREQQLTFPAILTYFQSKLTVRDMPELVQRLNIFKDSDGLLKVKAKFTRWKDRPTIYPILLSETSALSKKILISLHRKLNHAGCYTVLNEFRKQFWIPKVFSFIKGVIKECVSCGRFSIRPIFLNQSMYRDFRVAPPAIPFRYLFLDYIGPFFAKTNNAKAKVYILCLTCL